MLTSRIEQLKKQFFTHVPAVCLEGALSKTHVFKETEGEPMINYLHNYILLSDCSTYYIT